MRLLLLLLLLSACGSGSRIVVQRADQLPTHKYAVTPRPSELLRDDSAFKRFATTLESDLKTVLRRYQIADRATRKAYYATLFRIAFLNGRWDAGLAYLDSLGALEDTPAERLLSGVFDRPYADAMRGAPERVREQYATGLARELNRLPYDSVRGDLVNISAKLQGMIPAAIVEYVRAALDSAAASDGLLVPQAMQLVELNYVMRVLSPLRVVIVPTIGRLIDRHAEQTDIWPARDVSLSDSAGLFPVVTAVWDGNDVDLSVFPGLTWINPREIAGNNHDDDGNGLVDDVHGIAWSWAGAAERELLRPVPMAGPELLRYQRYFNGRSDLQRGGETTEAVEYAALLDTLAGAGLRSFEDGMVFYDSYAHGTMVAGVVARGNPAVRLVVVRTDFARLGRPPLPTLRWAQAQADAMRKTVAYLQAANTRIATLSWGYEPQMIEDDLALHQSGTENAQRRDLARQYFAIVRDALHSSMAAAEEILFVVAAGNENTDNRTQELMPATFDLPNVITVGATDRSGKEAAFSNYGKVDIYALGDGVDVLAPGGDRVRYSGTSLAAPQVANLAAKLLAINPRLTTMELRRAILEGAEQRRTDSGRTIRVLNAKASLGLNPAR